MPPSIGESFGEKHVVVSAPRTLLHGLVPPYYVCDPNPYPKNVATHELMSAH